MYLPFSTLESTIRGDNRQRTSSERIVRSDSRQLASSERSVSNESRQLGGSERTVSRDSRQLVGSEGTVSRDSRQLGASERTVSSDSQQLSTSERTSSSSGWQSGILDVEEHSAWANNQAWTGMFLIFGSVLTWPDTYFILQFIRGPVLSRLFCTSLKRSPLYKERLCS